MKWFRSKLYRHLKDVWEAERNPLMPDMADRLNPFGAYLWRGERLEDLEREELLVCARFLMRKYMDSMNEQAIEARALGRVEMLKRGVGK